MSSLDDAVREFLSLRRIAVVGISRDGANPGNAIYKKLREAGIQVFAVNPFATDIDGDPCYADLRSIPGGVEGVVITTHPSVTERIVADASDAGVRQVWIHRGIGRGSLSSGATRLCQEKGIGVIAGACPLMYARPVDPFHACLRWIQGITGGLPRPPRAPVRE